MQWENKAEGGKENWRVKEHRIGMRVGIGMPIIELSRHPPIDTWPPLVNQSVEKFWAIGRVK